MSALVSVLLSVGVAHAATTHSATDGHSGGHTGGTGEETGNLHTGTATGTTWYDHSAPEFCDECVGAAQLAGDDGGSPCDEGCSTGGRSGLGWLAAPLLLMVRRRRA